MYPIFVSSLVPSYMPEKFYWVYLTGAGMIAAAISLVINVKVNLSGTLLTIMISAFLVQLHMPLIYASPLSAAVWTRALQDTALAASALMLTCGVRIEKLGSCIYCIVMMGIGALHYCHVPVITANAPVYLTYHEYWNDLIGLMMISLALCTLLNFRAGISAAALCALIMMLIMISIIPALITDIHNPTIWTLLAVDIGIAGGALILAGKKLSKSSALIDNS
ncbi:MAG: hypothetical protein ACXVB0_01790 [Mucilaginibacter sp.]